VLTVLARVHSVTWMGQCDHVVATLPEQPGLAPGPSGVTRLAPRRPARGTAATVPGGAPAVTPRPEELASALRDGRLLVAQQPIVALGDGTLCGSETLVRWQHPRLGLLLPGRFLPLVRTTGTSAALDLHVLRAACRRLADDPGLPPTSINVSRSALLRPGFVAAVLCTLREHDVPGERVMLELSEHLTLDDLELVREQLTVLRRYDVRLVLDDLGAGATTLQHVRTLRPAWVKIDRRLVQRVDTDPARLEVVRRAVELAASMGAGATAEGIERPEEAAALLDAGCERGQGWLFGRPVLQGPTDVRAPATADGGVRAAG
jgi:diguanylate cyclase